MEEVNITEHEARFFSDLFSRCDIEKTGKVPVLKATEMFRSSDTADDVLKTIMSLAGIPQAALYMSKVQFYSCLKLIAAHQNAIQLRQELIASTITLPLPKFSWKESPVLLRTENLNGKVADANRWRSSDDLSPNLIELARTDAQSDIANSDITSTDSEVEHNEKDKKIHQRRAGSPDAWSTASDSPTPTNSVAERPWAKNPLWQGQLEERTQLLGTEEESSDRHSSEEDNEADLETVYQITPEQKEYYIKQFRKIQPDLHGLLSGQAAKVFFEKSRIPVEELRHIWQLCDITKDGALNLPEFAAAMHLVVLRRNNIPLPPILPECLIPNATFFDIIQPAEADLLHIDDDNNQVNSLNTSTITTEMQNLSFDNKLLDGPLKKPNSLVGSHTGSNRQANIKTKIPPNSSHKGSTSSNSPSNDLEVSPTKSNKISNHGSKEWTKFSESPTSNVSSPGPKPVNFDMQRTAQAVVSDPQILHPVPLLITPVANENVEERTSYQRKSDGGIITIRDAETSSPKHHTVPPHESTAIQRPQPKKIKNNVGAIPPPPQRESTISAQNSTDLPDSALNNSNVPHNKKESPPTPPPRPQKHTRSSSLDLNKLKLVAPVPPEVPPRVSPQISLDAQLEAVNTSFADFTQFPEESNDISRNQPQSLDIEENAQHQPRPTIPSFQSSQRSSAFEVYRKPTPRDSASPESHIRFNDMQSRVLTKNDSKNLNDVMCHLKEQNQSLNAICSDLSDELLSVQQKRAELLAKIQCDVNSGSNS